MASRPPRYLHQQQQFTIYDESAFDQYTSDHRMSTSPSPYDADNGLSSDENDNDNDSVLPTIESIPNARQSSAAFTSVSSIPPSLPYNSDISPYTPRKGNRPAFRSPSSVRALQMSSPPPFHQYAQSARMGSPVSARRQRGGTPSSIRSGSVLHHARSGQEYDEQHSVISHGQESGRGTPSVLQQQQIANPPRGPLVLLHVTMLPSPGLPYSIETLQEHAPGYVLQNWYMLQEKLTETVLSRGVLIPHPGEEFDLLEESLLEALGLQAPRISSCGHFHGSHSDSDTDSGNDSGVSGVGNNERQLITRSAKSHRWSMASTNDDACQDCAQPIRMPGRGIGAGTARWEVRVYASNGLLSAGAWFAAHREMERVDVEIEPWIPEDVKRALDIVTEKEQEQLRKENEELERLRFDLEVMQRLRAEADDERARAEQRAADLELDLVKAKQVTPPTLPTPVQPASPEPDNLVVPKARHSSVTPDNWTPTPLLATTREPTEVPLSTLLRNYLILLAQDRRNIAVGVLSVLVIFLALRLGTPTQAARIGHLADTMPSRYGNSILSASSAVMVESRHPTPDSGMVMQVSFSEPVIQPSSTESTLSEGSLPIPTPSSDLGKAEPTQEPMAAPESVRPELQGAAHVSHFSVLQDESAEDGKRTSSS